MTTKLSLANALMIGSTFALAASLALTNYSLLCMYFNSETRNVENNVKSLREDSQRLSMLLFVYSIFVVTGIVELQSWMSLPNAWTFDGVKQLVISNYAHATSSLSGMRAVVLLAILFVSSLCIHRQCVEKLAKRSSLAESNKWKEDNGLHVGMFIVSLRSMAIMAPALANPAFSVLGKVLDS